MEPTESPSRMLVDLIDQTVSENVRVYREAAGLTQRQLADRLTELGWGIDNTAVARIEAGSRSLRSGQLALFARALGRSPADFFEGDRVRNADLGLSQLFVLMLALEDAVLELLEQRDEMRARLSDPSLANWGHRRTVEQVMATPVTDLVAGVVWRREREGYGFVPGAFRARRDSRTLSRREQLDRIELLLNAASMRYVDVVQPEVQSQPPEGSADVEHPEAP